MLIEKIHDQFPGRVSNLVPLAVQSDGLLTALYVPTGWMDG